MHEQAKSAAQQYKAAVNNNTHAAHDKLAAATAKGVEDAHAQITSGTYKHSASPGARRSCLHLAELQASTSCIEALQPAMSEGSSDNKLTTVARK